ncbi:MAG: hypothetical protein RIC55_22035 [Pirellulaceae bacterium]
MPEPPSRPRPAQPPTPSDFLPPQPDDGAASRADAAIRAEGDIPQGIPVASPGASKANHAPRKTAVPQARPLQAAPLQAAPLQAKPLSDGPTTSAAHAGVRRAAALPQAAPTSPVQPAQSGGFVVTDAKPSAAQRYKGRKSGAGSLLLMAGGGVLALAAIAAGGYYLLSQETNEPADQNLPGAVASTDGQRPARPKTDIVDKPAAENNVDRPTPQVIATPDSPPVVPPKDEAPAIAELLRAKGLPASLKNGRTQYADGRSMQEVDIEGERVEVLQFASAMAAARSIAQLDSLMASLGRRGHVYRHESALVFYEGRDPRVISQLELALGGPLHAPEATTVAVNNSFDQPGVPTPTFTTPTIPDTPTTTNPPDTATAGATTAPPETAASELEASENEQILTLFDEKQLISTKSYPMLRGIYASRFERAHRAEIDAAFDDQLKQWLDEHVDIKEEFFTAIKPQDDVARALSMFAALSSAHREDFADHWNVAVAVAVTWDGGRRSIEEFAHHQRRCSAILPEDLVGAEENFAYLLGTDSGRYLPWEFLCYVVNHRTAIPERQWAAGAYMPRRKMIGEIYSDVEYDTVMLQTSSKVCRLNGQDYTLPNILRFGGVCAMQADFASRVGKSLGIPAAYVRGESNSGDFHAWVEWVVLNQVGPKKISFSLESHGRYRGDAYYVGTLGHPQTGLQTTDRQMELELHTVGMDRTAKRHAALVMKSWPMIRQQKELPVGEQFAFLAEVTGLCPGETDAWREMAAINKSGKVEGKDRRLAVKALDELFRTYANFPDFTWVVFDDMIAFEPDLKKRIGLFQRLVAMYVTAKRPDLASQAQLKLTDMLLEDGQVDAAGNGLIQMLLAFADDGRNVRPALERLEVLCKGAGDQGAAILDTFWQSFLPRVPKTRGGTPTQHAYQMHQRALEWYQSRGNTAAIQAVQLEIAKIQAGG